MNAFRRLSTVATVPELLRQDAERRAAAICRALPAAVWCRPALIASARGQDRGRRQRGGLMSSLGDAAWQRPPPAGTSLAAAAHPAWSRSIRIVLCFRGADALLATARVLNGCGLLSPEGVGAFFAGAERLTRAGMRAWRGGRVAVARQR